MSKQSIGDIWRADWEGTLHLGRSTGGARCNPATELSRSHAYRIDYAVDTSRPDGACPDCWGKR